MLPRFDALDDMLFEFFKRIFLAAQVLSLPRVGVGVVAGKMVGLKGAKGLVIGGL